MYHFVWIPKYRHKVFSEPYRKSKAELAGGFKIDYDIDIVELKTATD